MGFGGKVSSIFLSVALGFGLPSFILTDDNGDHSSGAFLRQTVLFTAYETPETRALFNKSLKNVAGKIRTEQPWPPLQIPEGVEPVSALKVSYVTLYSVHSLGLCSLRLFKSER